MKARAFVEVRRQSPSGIWPKSGPDTYVAVQIVPIGVIPLRSLSTKAAEKRGIEIKYFGEGYSSRCKTTHSMLGKALADARKFAEQFNTKQEATAS